MEDNCNGLISVIVPVYNAEKVMKRCLNSIVGQSYKKLEIILVDDGSIDSSADICDFYEKIDERVNVFHIKNSGVSAARNIGLNNAKGEYIIFVDADDWIEDMFCETLMHYAKKYDAKVVKSLAINRDEKGQIKKDKFEIANTLIIDVEKEFSFLAPYATGVVWGTLYKSDLIKDIRFETDLYVGEDTLFFAQAVKKCEKIIISKEKMYNYIFYTESASHGSIDERKLSNLVAWERVIDCFRNNKRISKSAKSAYVGQCVVFLQKMCEGEEKNKKCWSICKKGLRMYMIDALLTDSFLRKVKYVCAYISPNLLCLFRKRVKR